MKITKLQTWLVRPRWAFIEISTDAGISGWGEPVLEGRAATVCECIHEMEPYLIGADPMKIEDLWTVLFRGGFYRGGGILMSAISGIDQALWDIKGKYCNVPVWQLMGGSCRDKMRVYSWVGGDRPADVGRAALEKKQQGFTAIKMNGTDELQFLDSYAKIDALLERVASVRESCGKDFGIAIDFHGRVHKPMAKIVAKKLEEFDPMFIEEPVLCDNMEYFPEIAAACNIPHCPLGPVALASCLNLDATCYNAAIQEQSIGIHYNEGRSVLDYALNPEDFKFVNGFVSLPQKPGLGVEVNKALVEEEGQTPHSWKNPVWRHEDGSVAEW